MMAIHTMESAVQVRRLVAHQDVACSDRCFQLQLWSAAACGLRRVPGAERVPHPHQLPVVWQGESLSGSSLCSSLHLCVLWCMIRKPEGPHGAQVVAWLFFVQGACNNTLYSLYVAEVYGVTIWKHRGAPPDQ